VKKFQFNSDVFLFNFCLPFLYLQYQCLNNLSSKGKTFFFYLISFFIFVQLETKQTNFFFFYFCIFIHFLCISRICSKTTVQTIKFSFFVKLSYTFAYMYNCDSRFLFYVCYYSLNTRQFLSILSICKLILPLYVYQK